jgi:N-acetylglutamate synthase-like GNAT family acetyltransferase
MLRKCDSGDIGRIFHIINEAARAYEDVIPDDCYQRPYMSMEELIAELKRVTFWGWENASNLVGVMGLEPIKDVHLIRHAYVLPKWQHRGIGGELIKLIKSKVKGPLLLGTWVDAQWAITFYEGHGFSLMPDKDRLLKTYWDIPQRQIDTSVVMGFNIDGLNPGQKEFKK